MAAHRATKEKFIEISTDSYVGSDSMTMARESYRGSSLYGLWVLRDADGQVIDQDMYRNDLAERNNIGL